MKKMFIMILALISFNAVAGETYVQPAGVPFTNDEYLIDSLLQVASVAQPATAMEIYQLLNLSWCKNKPMTLVTK